jgi:cytochrome P450
VAGGDSLPPGPRAPRALQAYRYTFDLPRFFAECAIRYGSTWTLRLHGFPPAVVTSDREAIRRLFTGDPLAKRHGNDLLAPIVGPRSVLLLEPREHLVRRRLELPAFHGEGVRRYAAGVRDRTEREVGAWRRGTVVEVHSRAQALTLDVILELVLGVTDARLRARLAESFEAMDRPLNNLGLFLPRWMSRPWNPLSRPFWSLIARVRRLLQDQIVATRADPALPRRDDVLAQLVRARDEHGHGLTDTELVDELVTLVSAGHETTATAIAWAADLLAHNPDVAARVRATLAAGDRDYLKAAAKEVLRARTVAPVSATRLPLEPFPIGTHVIDGGAVVLVDAYDLHRDPALYPDPEAFRPERFLDDPPDGYSYIPFGGGAHRCLGAALATLELETALATIATRCELAPDGPPARPARRGVTLTPDNRGRVRIVETLRPAPVGTASPAR